MFLNNSFAEYLGGIFLKDDMVNLFAFPFFIIS